MSFIGVILIILVIAGGAIFAFKFQKNKKTIIENEFSDDESLNYEIGEVDDDIGQLTDSSNDNDLSGIDDDLNAINDLDNDENANSAAQNVGIDAIGDELSAEIDSFNGDLSDLNDIGSTDSNLADLETNLTTINSD